MEERTQKLYRFQVRVDGYGVVEMLAASTAHLLQDLQILKDQGLTLTILRQERRG